MLELVAATSTFGAAAPEGSDSASGNWLCAGSGLVAATSGAAAPEGSDGASGKWLCAGSDSWTGDAEGKIGTLGNSPSTGIGVTL